jgi:hypothetical protein
MPPKKRKTANTPRVSRVRLNGVLREKVGKTYCTEEELLSLLEAKDFCTVVKTYEIAVHYGKMVIKVPLDPAYCGVEAVHAAVEKRVGLAPWQQLLYTLKGEDWPGRRER